MDVRCPVCAEPWDTDELHYLDIPFKQAYRKFQIEGCAVFGNRHNIPQDEEERRRINDQTAIIRGMYDILGDDVDGAAAEMEDLFDG